MVRAPPCHGGGRGFESHPGRLQIYICINFIIWDHSSAGRASALQAEGHRFEPYWSHLYADMAQLAEQLICNQQVIGSSPIVGFSKTKAIIIVYVLLYGWIPERPKGADCKSVDDVFEGSNPSPSISFISVKVQRLR